MRQIIFWILAVTLLFAGAWFFFGINASRLFGYPSGSQNDLSLVYTPMQAQDLIRPARPQAGDRIKSPLAVLGDARGPWYFEATFPIVLTDWDGRIIAQSFATAQGEWMTTEFVPFEGTLEFEKPEFGERGFLILQRSNASGLPEHDAAVEIPVFFE